MSQTEMLNAVDEMLLYAGLNTSTTATAGTTLTVSGLLEAMRLVNTGLIARRGPTHVRESLMATRTVPVKLHKKRSNQTEAYHRRVQKKWQKRYGTRKVPAAYMIDNSALWGSGETLVAHPEIVARLKMLEFTAPRG